MKIKDKKKRFLIVFTAIVFAIIVFTIFGKNGLIDAYMLRKERNKIAVHKNEIEEENKKLSEEINLLKRDKRYIAKVAREELGMIGKDEIIYKVENK